MPTHKSFAVFILNTSKDEKIIEEFCIQYGIYHIDMNEAEILISASYGKAMTFTLPNELETKDLNKKTT